MLTGGIDLSVGMIASMAAFIMATQTPIQGPAVAIVLALAACALGGPRQRHRHRDLQGPPADHDPGHGPGDPRADDRLPADGRPVRHARSRTSSTGSARRPRSPSCRTTCSCSSRSPRLIIVGLRYSGYGRLLFAVGDNPVAARLSGVRVWQVLVALYILSALLAGASPASSSPGSSRRRAVSLVEPARCCRRWRPRSSAGRRSWVAAAGTPGRSSGRSS